MERILELNKIGYICSLFLSMGHHHGVRAEWSKQSTTGVSDQSVVRYFGAPQPLPPIWGIPAGLGPFSSKFFEPSDRRRKPLYSQTPLQKRFKTRLKIKVP